MVKSAVSFVFVLTAWLLQLYEKFSKSLVLLLLCRHSTPATNVNDVVVVVVGAAAATTVTATTLHAAYGIFRPKMTFSID